VQRVFLVSGATSGIGLVTVQKLAAMGCYVYAVALPSDDFSVLPEGTIPLHLDITDSASLQEVANQITTEHGYLSGLVNNAGIQVPGALEALPIEQIRKQFEVNVFGHLQMIQALLPLLRKGENPRIVNVSSLMGKVAMPMLGAYSMSKHALEAMTDVLRLELTQWGIHVAAIEPGAVATPMTASMQSLMQQSYQAMSGEMQELYGEMVEGMIQALQKQSKAAVSAEPVADAIIHALTSPKPKTRYPIGTSTVGLITMRKLAPDSIGDAILKRALNLKHTFNK
jgi:NAD(P)-dependent dehydrogenase (short-subunit alcohol dehydrogenase family)